MDNVLCGQWNEFEYYFVNDKCILGNNNSRALISGKTCPEVVIIPQYVNGNPVLEIGKNSLSGLVKIKEITILARITQINTEAISYCAGLEKINIPSTCLYMFFASVHLYNNTYGGDKPAPGTTNVIFEPNSRIQYIGDNTFSYRENLNVYFCSPINPIIHEEAFKVVTNKNFYSPYDFWLTDKNVHVHNNDGLPDICYDPKTKFTCKCKIINIGLDLNVLISIFIVL